MTTLRGVWLFVVTLAAYYAGRREGRDQGERAAWHNAAAVFTAGMKEGKR